MEGSIVVPIRVVILGGGTAGWMTAAALSILLSRQMAQVTLVESEEVGIIGVGEATLPHIRAFNERLGIDEADFMRATGATFKLGIEFRDWARIGDSYIHPFGVFGHDVEGVGFHHYLNRAGRIATLFDYSVPIVAAREARFAPPAADPRSLASTYGYAYQFDATRYGPYLRNRAEAAGTRRIEGRVEAVERSEHGDIAALRLSDGRRVEGDLFVDCSGFRSLLLGQACDEPFEDWSRWLPCDRAVAVPCEGKGPLLPYTSAVAMSAGWRWRIPLQHRTGNGYVYSSAHIGDDAAREQLLSELEGPPLAEPRLLRFKAGRRRRNWVRNVIGIGLSGGFLEPLESTSIYLIQIAITRLIELFPQRPAAAIDRDAFNRAIDLEYDRIRDFLILHYHATQRDDSPFWNHVRTMEVPESLSEKMALFRKRGRVARYREGLFLEPSWLAVYFGQRIVPTGYDQRADGPDDGALTRALDQLRQEVAAAAAALPDQSVYLERVGALA
ncbi:tryptophan halogenase family protein [Stakelama pacifica]|uniref:Tryptophan halogenase n=1 Tax=Stakelama pacifica TaxID=517720 RepID=A0A4R6FWX9_9SPHN|nr:tryptophan halogenase family protein [Stakelama pacifica]TDN85544.1 tryptophan halogenase [Stakelama pacifica]